MPTRNALTPPRPLNPRQVADTLGCSVATVYRLIDNGQLPSFRLGSGHCAGIRVTVADVDAFIARGGAR